MRELSADLAVRVREIRLNLYGEDGGPKLAGELGLPARTWANYESGVAMPAMAILRFIAITGASPGWLLDGTGDAGVSAMPASKA